MDYATGVYEKLKAAGIRTELDHKDEKVGYKIRQAQLEKVQMCIRDRCGAGRGRNVPD